MLYNFARGVLRIFFRIIFRVRVVGKENFPQDGPIIVSINHTSYWDVPLVAAFLPRKLHYMAKQELFRIPIFGRFIRAAGAFPVMRGKGDIAAVRTALSALKEGKAIAIFPEGRRVKKGMSHDAKPGVALIAERSAAPILPVAIGGRYRLFAKVPIVIGKPIAVEAPETGHIPSDELKAISADLVRTILNMAEDA